MSAGFYISILLLLIVLLRTLVVLFNLITNPVLPRSTASPGELVSILIPARNEESNIGHLLSDLRVQSYRNVEIVVYDDSSTDGTLRIIDQMSAKDSRVRVINGIALPPGWLGKTHACYRLGQQAEGEFLIFFDADVRVAPWVVNSIVRYLSKNRLALLSIFPNQLIKTFGEELVVPSMNWILLSMLPLRLVKWSKRRSLAAANGQVMAFEGARYRKYEWHKQAKGEVAEDIAIARSIKRSKERMATLMGRNDIYCRMYSSYGDAIDGFAKNIAAFFGGSFIATGAFMLAGALGPFIAFIYLPLPYSLLFLIALLLSRATVSALSSQSAVRNIILWPAQHLALIHITIRAIMSLRNRPLIWKGRVIRKKQSPN